MSAHSGWHIFRSFPSASLKLRTSWVRAAISSCSTRGLSMLPSELILAIEMERGELMAPPSIPLLDAPSLAPSILFVIFAIQKILQ